MKKINRIFLFGDSWVEGQGTYETLIKSDNDILFQEPNISFEKIGEWRKENSWNKFIKEKTECEVINYALQGCDNYIQFEKLNSIFNSLTKNDLVLFGFTSKLRDRAAYRYAFDFDYNENSKLLHDRNPIKSQLAWEKISFTNYNFGILDKSVSKEYSNKNERDFTEKLIKDYFTFIYDDYPLEYISQFNYYFYQERFKNLGLNLVCFDLFEPYVTPKFTKNGYSVDKDIYITFESKTMNEYLIDFEKNNITSEDISLWEDGKRRPDLEGKIYHPNQHGYKLYVDYLFDDILKTKYKFF